MVDRNWDPILGVRSDEGASAAPPRSSHERRRILAQVRPHTHTYTHAQQYIYCRLSIYYLFIIGLMPDKLQHTLKSQDQHRVQDQDYKL